MSEVTSNQFEALSYHSVVGRPASFYKTKLVRAKLELIQVVEQLDAIDEIPAWKKVGMLIFRGQQYSDLVATQVKATRDKVILKKHIEMATDLMAGDTTYHSERGFDGYEAHHGLQFIDLTTDEIQSTNGHDADVLIDLTDTPARVQ